jgi:hypothetical protein
VGQGQESRQRFVLGSSALLEESEVEVKAPVKGPSPSQSQAVNKAPSLGWDQSKCGTLGKKPVQLWSED